jgi:hypothetical protein
MHNELFNASIPDKSVYVNRMDITKIDTISNTIFFDNIKIQNITDILIDVCKRIFLEAYNNEGREAGAIINIHTGELAIHKATMYNAVDFNDDYDADYYKIAQNSSKNSCIVIHTHNNYQGFSLVDIKTFLSDDMTVCIMVIKADASINIMVKPRNNYSKIIKYLEEIYKFDVITPDIREMLKNYGLIERSLKHD